MKDAAARNRRAAVNIRMMSVVFNVFYRFVIYFCNLFCGFSGIVYANLSLANNGLRNVLFMLVLKLGTAI